MTNAEELKSKVRAVTEEDRKKLPTFSYSKLDIKKKCPFKYDLRYNQKKFTHTGSVATEVGTLVHWCLEQKALSILNCQEVSYPDIEMSARIGVDSLSPKGKNAHIYGTEEIAMLYPEDYYTPDKVTNKNYKEKIGFFLKEVLPKRMEEVNGWAVWGAEVPFEFVYDEKCIMHGFIDRIDVSLDKNGKPIIRITDYKTSKKIYDEKTIKTPLQMVVYDLACLQMMKQLPSAHVYDFVLLDEQQTEQDGVCTLGYLKRGLKQLDKLLTEQIGINGVPEYEPDPSPLCYYCEFCNNNPNAESKFKNLCPYYSLWTPMNRIYNVNMEYKPGIVPRKLDFDF